MIVDIREHAHGAGAALAERLTVAHERRRGDFGGGIKCEDQHR